MIWWIRLRTCCRPLDTCALMELDVPFLLVLSLLPLLACRLFDVYGWSSTFVSKDEVSLIVFPSLFCTIWACIWKRSKPSGALLEWKSVRHLCSGHICQFVPFPSHSIIIQLHEFVLPILTIGTRLRPGPPNPGSTWIHTLPPCGCSFLGHPNHPTAGSSGFSRSGVRFSPRGLRLALDVFGGPLDVFP